MNKTLNKVVRFSKKNAPTILTVLSVVGLATTVVSGVVVTPKAILLLEDAKEQKGDDLTVWETIKTAGPCYIGTVASGIATTACIVGSNGINLRRNASLAGLYAITDRTFKEYQHQVIEQIGEKKHREIKDGIAKKIVNETKDERAKTVIIDGGDVLFFDPISGRYFRCTVNKILQTQAMLNHRMRTEMDVTLNNFYSEIRLDEISLGDTNGWSIDRGYIDITFSTQLTDDNEPCVVLEWEVFPLYAYAD